MIIIMRLVNSLGPGRNGPLGPGRNSKKDQQYYGVVDLFVGFNAKQPG